ncbi:MAG: hypothetical protein ACYTFT_07085 [Planctomycetota bacterium]|jgi:hypothetical protein
MKEIYHRFLGQLDSVWVLLALSDKDVRDFVEQRHPERFPPDKPEARKLYEVQIAHAGYLLGYSYAEAYFNDLAREIYLRTPSLLPPETKLRFKEVLAQPDMQGLIEHLVDSTLFQAFRGSASELIRHYDTHLGLPLEEENKRRIIEGSLIRNCLVHRRAIVDARLAAYSPRFTKGQAIELTIAETHDFGQMARKTAASMLERAEERYG